MNGRKALRALADGKRVRDADGDVWSLDERGTVYINGRASNYFGMDPEAWEIVEDPATDEELIAEMERRADSHAEPQASAYAACARMLRERKVAP